MAKLMLYLVMVPGKTRSIAVGYVSWGWNEVWSQAWPPRGYSCRHWEKGLTHQAECTEMGQRWYRVKPSARDG